MCIREELESNEALLYNYYHRMKQENGAEFASDQWLLDGFEEKSMEVKPIVKIEQGVHADECATNSSVSDYEDMLEEDDSSQELGKNRSFIKPTCVASPTQIKKENFSSNKEAIRKDNGLLGGKVKEANLLLQCAGMTTNQNDCKVEASMECKNTRTKSRSENNSGRMGSTSSLITNDASRIGTRCTGKTNKTQFSFARKKNVSVDAIPGLCNLKCPHCSLLYQSWTKFRKHVKAKHKEVLEVANFQRYLSKITVHVCRICREDVFCETYSLFTHMGKHKLRLTDYRETYERGTSRKEKLENILRKGRLSSHIIGSLCTFRCPECDMRHTNLHSFRQHTYKHHYQSKTQIHFWIKYLEDVVTHKCKICSKLLLNDTTIIRLHVQGEHNMKSLKEYAKRNGLKYVWRDFNTHNNALSNCQEDTRQVGNICKFACSACSHNTMTWRSMKKHLNISGHDTSFRKEWSKYIEETRFHKCLICKRNVLNDRVFLENHLNNHHKKKFTQYVKEFKLIQVKR